MKLACASGHWSSWKTSLQRLHQWAGMAGPRFQMAQATSTAPRYSSERPSAGGGARARACSTRVVLLQLYLGVAGEI
jgi:hypothetical protein